MNSAKIGSRACPVCGREGRHRILYSRIFQEGVLGNGYDVVVCPSCGAGFADGIPSQDILDRYYADQSKYAFKDAGGSESEYDARRFQTIVERLVPLLPSKSARILDIGCATGRLLAEFKRLGFTKLLGVDPSPGCASAARLLHGIDVRVGNLRDLSTWTDRFDLVIMVGVLEHLREAAAAVTNAVRLVTNDGAFYASVPDVIGLPHERNAPFQQFSMEHVNFFSASSLAHMVSGTNCFPVQSWHDMVEWRKDVTEATVSILFDRRPGIPEEFDSVTLPALETYLARSQEMQATIAAQIDSLANARKPLLVWGAGAFTRSLLASTRLGEMTISGFVDSNPHLAGTTLAGRKVLSPEAVKGRDEPILICSVAFEDEIRTLIRDRLNLPNQLIALVLSEP